MNLIGLIKSKTREKILRLFFKNKEKKYYLRELERILKLPVGNIRRELISLEKIGLFKHEKVGNLVYYFLNKSSPFFGVVEDVLLKTSSKKKEKEFRKEFNKNINKEFIVTKKDDLDLLISKVRETGLILENLLQRKSEVEDFLNLGVVINNQGEILMVKRAEKERGKGGVILTWVFPGGKQRFNESRAECVARGVLTETGYKIKSIKEISSRFHPQFPVFIIYHFCNLVSSKPLLKPTQPNEIAEIRWVKPKEIHKLITTDLDSKVAKYIGLK